MEVEEIRQNYMKSRAVDTFMAMIRDMLKAYDAAIAENKTLRADTLREAMEAMKEYFKGDDAHGVTTFEVVEKLEKIIINLESDMSWKLDDGVVILRGKINDLVNDIDFLKRKHVLDLKELERKTLRKAAEVVRDQFELITNEQELEALALAILNLESDR